MPLLDIIISSFGDPAETPSHLKLCLLSIRHFTSARHNIIVERSYSNASLNRNRGLQRSNSPFICFVDDDVWMTPGWDKELLTIMREDSTIGMASPVILQENGLYFSCGLKYCSDNYFPMAYGQHSITFSLKGFEPDALPTTCLMIKRAALEVAGYFDTNFSECQWEDIDFYLRLRLSNFKGVVASQSKVYHAHFFRSSSFNNNYQYLLQKWHQYSIVTIDSRYAKVLADTEICSKEGSFVIEGFSLLREMQTGKPQIFVNGEQQLLIKIADPLDSKAVEIVGKEYYIYQHILKDYPSKLPIIGSIRLSKDLQNSVIGIILPYVESSGQIKSHANAIIPALVKSLHQFHQVIPSSQLRSLPETIIPTLYSGHQLFIGGAAIILDIASHCHRRDAGFPLEQLARTIRHILKLKKEYTRLFPPENFVLVHGDFTFENILSPISTALPEYIVIDYAECCLGPSVYDLVKLSLSLRLDAQGEADLIQYYHRYCDVDDHSWPQSPLSRLMAGFNYLKPVILLDQLTWIIVQLYDHPDLQDKLYTKEKIIATCITIEQLIDRVQKQSNEHYVEKL